MQVSERLVPGTGNRKCSF